MQEKSLNELIINLTKKPEWENKKIVFLLGAGCSISSGIPGAHDLAVRWLQEIRELYPNSSFLPRVNEKNAGKHYFQVFRKRFDEPSKKEAIQKFTHSITPSSGYIAFANLLEQDKFQGRNRFSLILTTNFDSLIEQSLTIYTKIRPSVISDSSLFKYLEEENEDNYIVKIHGDRNYNPKNTVPSTTKIIQGIQDKIAKRIKNSILIVLGYSGGDKGVVSLLERLVEKQNIEQIWWVKNNSPEKMTLKSSIIKKNFYHVKHSDFDNFMLKWQSESNEVKHISSNILDQHIYKYHERLMWQLGLYGNSGYESFKVDKNHFDDYFKDIIEIKVKIDESPKKNRLQKFLERKLEKHLSTPNYQVFIASIMKNMTNNSERAEKVLRDIIKEVENHAAANAELALLLKDKYIKERDELICNEIDKYFNNATKYDKYNWNYKLNHSGFLLQSNNYTIKKKGKEDLKECLNNIYEPIQYMEACFYAFTHNVNEHKYRHYLDIILKTLKNKKRSPYFDLTLNVESAVKDNHKHKDFIPSLAKVITNSFSKNEDNEKITYEVLEKLEEIINEYS